MILSMLVSPMYSFADTTASTTSGTAVVTTSVSASVQALLDQIKNLQTQLAALKAAQEQVVKAQVSVSQSLTLIRSLRQGMSGDDVKALQIALAADTTVYPEGAVTGYYGRLTSEAVKKFQKKYGIETVGFVGPKTLQKLNEEMDKLTLSHEDGDNNDENDNKDNEGDNKNNHEKRLCVKVPPGHLVAPGWRKNKGEDSEESIVPTCQVLPYGIEKKLSDDRRATTTPPVATTTPDTIVPTFFNISATTASTSANILWTTNELATGKVWYATTSPLVFATTTPVMFSGTLELNHNLKLTNLATSTSYFYVVTSSDSAGNTATSSQNSFTTLAN